MISHSLRSSSSRWRARATLLVALVLGRGSGLCGAEVTINGRLFQIPDGMELEIVAQPPLVDRPITAAYDEQGFLYVTESSGTNDNVEKQLAQRPHRVLRLEDVDRDGLYDRRTIFADQMMFPEGSLWHNGSLYVAAPPTIWKLTDTDSDGIADQREEWFQAKTLTGCANDLHGPYLGRDGWIYWCKGAFAEQTYVTPGRGQWSTTAAHIFRRHPREGWVEPVMTGGMDNPVDMVITPEGERMFTTTFLQHPAGGKRDGLIHAIYGGLYGKDHGVINGHVRTGDLMPVMTHLGAAAPAGLTLLESNGLGPEYRGNVIAALFNMHKVTRHQLQPHGATYATVDTDLVATDDIDFHPTDVLENHDGSVTIINTGGWYKLCCPTSQLWKPDVLGNIYRLRRAGHGDIPSNDTPLDWTSPTLDELVSRLSDSRWGVRQRAASLLAVTGDPCLPKVAELLEEHADAENGTNNAERRVARETCVWLLGRIGSPAAMELLLTHAAREPVAGLRQAALHCMGLWRYQGGLEFMRRQLLDDDAHVRRAAAEAIGRAGNDTCVDTLFEAARRPCDRVLLHSLAYALIEINAPATVRPYLNDTHTTAQQVALIVLDQLPAGELTAADLLPLLVQTDDEKLRETVYWIIERRTDWDDEVVAFLDEDGQRTWLNHAPATRLLTAFGKTAAMQQWLAKELADRTRSAAQRATLLGAMAASGADQLPESWNAPLRAIVDDSSSSDLVDGAVEVVRHLAPQQPEVKTWQRILTRAAQRDTLPVPTRLAILGALPPESEISNRLISLILSNIGTEIDVDTRTRAARALGRLKLTSVQLQSAAARAMVVGPLEIEPYLTIFRQTSDPAIADLLLSHLRESPALTSLNAEFMKANLASFGPEIQEQGVRLVASQVPGLDSQRTRIAAFIERLPQGDVRRGQQVFHGKQAACFTCHAMGYLGGQIGPDLTHIGRTRTAQDLLESILYPSTSFVRSYEPWSIETTNGQVINGVLREQDDQHVVLVTTTREEVRVPRTQIESMAPSSTSIMPTGLDQQLTEQALVDLVTFLLQSK